MQQYRPTPLVLNSVAFYKHQLRTLTLQSMIVMKAQLIVTCVMKALLQEVLIKLALVLTKYILSHKAEVKALTLFSDTCGGQNKKLTSAQCVSFH